jgi:DNA adenine methylase
MPTKTQAIKSPLRYPGGKSRAVEQIMSYLPPRFAEYREPFVGGGSLFVHLRQKHPAMKMWINDLNYELYCFWKCAQENADALADEIARVKAERSEGRALFEELAKADAGKLPDFERAVRFFVLNRITFSGTVEAGGFSQGAFEKRFTDSSVARVRRLGSLLRGVRITNLDYRELLRAPGEDVFLFLDPPYFSATHSRLYGKRGLLHTSFEHDQFAAELRECRHKWLVTYDDSEKVRDNFDFAHLYEWQLQYGMNNYKQQSAAKGKELFISNYEPSGESQMSLVDL